MKTLYDVQEFLKKYGYINLLVNRLDAIYMMKKELIQLYDQGMIPDQKQYFTAELILRREERIELEKRDNTHG
jgi:uncharacterized protein YqgQ